MRVALKGNVCVFVISSCQNQDQFFFTDTSFILCTCRVTSLADALRLDFALIHKDRSRMGPQGQNRPYSGMPKSGEGESSVRVYEEEEEAANDDVEDLTASISSLNEAGVNGDVVNAAVTVVADKDGESTITLVGDVRGKVAFLTVSMNTRASMAAQRTDGFENLGRYH